MKLKSIEEILEDERLWLTRMRDSFKERSEFESVKEYVSGNCMWEDIPMREFYAWRMINYGYMA